MRKSREGFVTHWATQPWIHTTAGEESLDIIYSNITASSTCEISFTCLISGLNVYPGENLTTILSLPGFKLADKLMRTLIVSSIFTIFQMASSISSNISISRETRYCRNSKIKQEWKRDFSVFWHKVNSEPPQKDSVMKDFCKHYIIQ